MRIFSAFALFGVSIAVFGADIDVQKQKMVALELKKSLAMELIVRTEKDPSAATLFCAKNATRITKEIGQKHSVIIKRVSEKNRNPQNIPDADDQKIINEFKTLLEQNKKTPEYLVVKNGDATKYYEPIYTNQLCAACHGMEDEIAKETKEQIKKLYPNDKAVGYKAGELRGLMVVW